MAYIVQADLSESLSETQLMMLTDDEKVGMVNADRVARVIVSAEAEVNGFLATRYLVPFAAPVPDLVQAWTLTVATYYLYRRRRVPEDIRTAYEDTIARLRDVAAGRLMLGVDPAPTEAGNVNAGEVFGPEPRVFTRDTLWGF